MWLKSVSQVPLCLGLAAPVVEAATAVMGTIPSCPSDPYTAPGTKVTCGTTTIKASGGAVTLAATPVTVPAGYTNTFTFSGCAGTALASGATCTLTIYYTATGIGTYSTTATVATTVGTGTTFAVSGLGVGGTLTAGPVPACPATVAGGAASVCGPVTITDTVGVAVTGTPMFTSSNPEFVVAPGTCTNAYEFVYPGTKTCTTGNITFQPAAGSTGTRTATITVATAVNGGTGTTFTVSGTALAAGTAILGPIPACPASPYTSPTTRVTCGTTTITASGGALALAATPVTVASPYNTTFTFSGCAGVTLTSGSSCTLTVYFTPTALAQETGTATVVTTGGTGTTFTVSGLGIGGQLVAGTAPSCPSQYAGGAAVTCGPITISNTVGITITGTPMFTSSNPEFVVTPGACTDNLQLLYPGTPNSCVTGNITFQPAAGSSGTRSATITVAAASGKGSGTSFVVSGTAIATGSAVMGTIPTCPASPYTSPTTRVTCGTTTITASGGSVTLAATPVTVAAPYNTTFTFSGCGGVTLASGTSCTLTVYFTPTALAQETGTATVVTTTGGGTTFTVSGLGTGGQLVAGTPPACPSEPAGAGTVTCGTLVISNTVGITITGTPMFTSSNPEFAIASGGCTDNLQLLYPTTPNTCTSGILTFTPAATSVGTRTATITVAAVAGKGTGTSFVVSGVSTSSAGILSVSTTTVACGTAYVTAVVPCSPGTVTLTASGGPVTLGAAPLSGSNTTSFSVPNGTCTPGLVLTAGSSCVTGPITFNPQVAGVLADTVTAQTTQGTGTTFTVNGTAVTTGSSPPGSLAVANTVSCATTPIGALGACTGTVTLTATGGLVELGNPVVAYSNAAEFPNSGNGTCSPNLGLPTNGSCMLGTFQFTPTAGGVRTDTLTFTPTAGTGATTSISGTALGNLVASPASLACPNWPVGQPAFVFCGTLTFTATGGTVTLPGPPYDAIKFGQYATSFSDYSSTCLGGTVLAAGQSCSATIVFGPQVVGNLPTTVNVTTSTGTAPAGNLTASTPTYAITTVGTPAPCGPVTLTANYGPVTLSATPFSGTDTTNFSISPAASDCQPNQVIASGASCTVPVMFTPTVAGTFTDTVTVNTSYGTGTSFVAKGDGNSYLQVLANPAPSCTGPGPLGTAQTCTQTLQAVGGSVTTNATFTSITSVTSISGCTGQTVAAGQTCVVTATINPTTLGAVFPFASLNYYGIGGWAQHTYVGWAYIPPGTYGSLTVTNNITCPATAHGASNACTGLFTLTATGGPVTLQAGAPRGLAYTDMDPTDFNVDGWTGTCVGQTTLAAGASCTTGNGQFHPATAGTKTDTLTFLPWPGAGTAGSTTWPAGGVVASGLTALSLANHWQVTPTGTCTGGTAGWVYSTWKPASGCGTVTQTRHAQCVVNTLSGHRRQTVSCVNGTGYPLADSYCASQPKPSTVDRCTPPASGLTCADPAGLLTRSVNLGNGSCSSPLAPVPPTCVANPAAGVYCVRTGH